MFSTTLNTIVCWRLYVFLLSLCLAEITATNGSGESRAGYFTEQMLCDVQQRLDNNCMREVSQSRSLISCCNRCMSVSDCVGASVHKVSKKCHLHSHCDAVTGCSIPDNDYKYMYIKSATETTTETTIKTTTETITERSTTEPPETTAEMIIEMTTETTTETITDRSPTEPPETTTEMIIEMTTETATETTTETTTEMTTETTTETITERSTTEPPETTAEMIIEMTTETTTEMITEKSTTEPPETTTEMIIEMTTETATETTTETTTEMTTETTTETITERSTTEHPETTAEMIIEVTTETTTETITERSTIEPPETTTEMIIEMTTETATETTTETTTEMTTETTTETIPERSTTEPPETTTEMIIEITTETTTETITEKSTTEPPETTTEMIIEMTTETATETTTETTTEMTTETTTETITERSTTEPPLCVHGTWQSETNTCACEYGYAGQRCDRLPHDCQEIMEYNPTEFDQTHTLLIKPLNSLSPFKMKCDGLYDIPYTYLFTNFGDLNFTNTWADYNNYQLTDFSYWMGLQNMRVMLGTEGKTVDLDYYFSPMKMISIRYTNFLLGDANTNYTLTYSSYQVILNDFGKKAIPGDCLALSNNTQFSTIDVDNDDDPINNCAQKAQAGWWFSTCSFDCNPMGRLFGSTEGPPTVKLTGINDQTMLDSLYSVDMGYSKIPRW